MRLQSLLLATAIVAFPAAATANSGNHFGWCNGAGNPHRAADCSRGGGTAGLPTPTPSTVPPANHLPGTGTGTGPTPGGTPAVITVQPLPPEVITGTSPVPTITGQPGPTMTGTSPGPIIVVPNPPLTFTGTGPVPQVQTIPSPSFTGAGQPTITIQPLPPSTFTGVNPSTTVQSVPAPSFTGQGLPQITVVPNPPQTVVGYGPVPASIIVTPQPSPSFTGTGAVPQIVPGAIPQATPTAIPQATPDVLPQATPVLMPRPRPRPATGAVTTTGGGQIAHSPTHQRAPLGPEHVAPRTGRAIPHDPPRFASSDGGRDWHCIASGHGQRRTLTNGEVTSTGALRHIGAVDVLGRDLPALHPDHTDCIISLRRRSGD